MPVDGVSGPVSVLDGLGERGTGKGVLPSGRSACAYKRWYNRAHAQNRHIILTHAAIQTNIFNVRRPLYIMTSHPMAGSVLEEVHLLDIPDSFPCLAASVRGRGWCDHERWILCEPEAKDVWLVQDIVPWWGTWSRELYKCTVYGSGHHAACRG